MTRALSLAGIGLGLLLGSIGTVSAPALLPAWIMVGGIVGGSVYMVDCDRAANGSTPDVRAIRHRAALVGTITTVVCLAITGLVTLLGAASRPAILLLALALCAWRARPHVPGRAPATGGSSGGHRPSPREAPLVAALRPAAEELSTPALCLAWHRSYFALLDTPEGSARQDIATWRRNLLDELARRDPAGVDDWLRNGARAGSDPSRYLDMTSDR